MMYSEVHNALLLRSQALLLLWCNSSLLFLQDSFYFLSFNTVTKRATCLFGRVHSMRTGYFSALLCSCSMERIFSLPLCLAKLLSLTRKQECVVCCELVCLTKNLLNGHFSSYYFFFFYLVRYSNLRFSFFFYTQTLSPKRGLCTLSLPSVSAD